MPQEKRGNRSPSLRSCLVVTTALRAQPNYSNFAWTDMREWNTQILLGQICGSGILNFAWTDMREWNGTTAVFSETGKVIFVKYLFGGS
jgi:hypothetical protein